MLFTRLASAGVYAVSVLAAVSLPSAAGAGLIWSDEFDGTGLSGAWTKSKFWWDGDGYNGADHVYRDNALSVSNGALSLTLRRDNATSWQGDPVQYVSGLVQTGGILGRTAPGFSYQYGYAEARIRMPKGQGIWPAFWTLPASYDDGAGELDIVEYIGSEERNVYSFVHTRGRNSGGSWTAPVDLSQDWHTYGMDWQPDHLGFYVDGVLRRMITDPALIPHEPEYLILNLQTGGDWAGFPDGTTPLPATMLVDYVRVSTSVPEPTAVAALVAALVWSSTRRRRRA
jgi:beta-glucanase (GH16 family)